MKVQSRLGVTVAGISPGHVAVTVNDGDTVNFTASGTDNQTITAEVVIDPAVDNITVATVDGVYTKLIDEVTYAELAALISGSDLIQGRQYLITDFATKHYMLNGGNTILSATNTATTEPIIVTASTINTLFPIAISTVYEQDILHYDWNPANWINDNAFSNVDTVGMNLGTIIPGWKGVITYREDTKQRNITHYDFRGVKFRRWALDPVAWNSGTTYAAKDKVLVGTKIYSSKRASNTNNLVSDTDWWIEVFDITDTVYWAYHSSSVRGIPVDTLDFIDVPTFAYNYEYVFSNNYIGLKHSDEGSLPYTSILPDIVFIGAGHSDDETGYQINGNRFEGSGELGNITVGDFFRFNTLGRNFAYNIIGDQFYFNDIKNNATQNVIYGSFTNNIIGNNFQTNEIATGFSKNIISNDFQTNVISSLFTLNNISNFFSNNTIGSTFNTNLIGPYFSLNRTGTTFTNNTTGSYFNSNTIGNTFTYNTIGQYFSSNTIENGFWRNTTGEGVGLCQISDDFRNNTMQGGNNINFTGAFHVYQPYTKLHFTTPDGTETLQYINDANTVVIADSNS